MDIILPTVDLSKDGAKIVVVGGFAKSWESFRKFEQIEFWSGEQKDIKKILANKTLPFGTKMVVISRFISHSELGQVLEEARKRNIPLWPNKSDGEISALLDASTKDLKVNIAEQKSERGKLKKYLAMADLSKPAVEEARRIYEICKSDGVKTTVESLSQGISVLKRNKGISGTPRSLKSKLDLSVEIFDAAINELGSIRDYLIEVVEENRILKKRLEKFKAALED